MYIEGLPIQVQVPTVSWLSYLEDEVETLLPAVLSRDEEVYVCTERPPKDGKAIKTMEGQKAADDFDNIYDKTRLTDLHVREEDGEQRYDVVLEIDDCSITEEYLGDETSLPDETSVPKIRYTHHIHTE